MRCTVQLKDLIDATKFCLQFISKAHAKLNHIQFSITRKTLTVRSFDGTTHAKHSVPCESNTKSAEFMLPGSLVAKFVAACSSDVIAIECDAHDIPEVNFSDGQSKYQFRTFNTLLPPFPNSNANPTGLPDVLFTMSRVLTACISNDDTNRFALNCIQIAIENGSLTATSSDARRMCRVSADCSNNQDIKLLLSSDVFDKITHFRSAQLQANDTMAWIKSGDTEVCTLMCAGKFPDIKKITSHMAKCVATRVIDRSTFQSIIQQAAIACTKEDGVNIKISERNMRLRGESADVGKAELSLECERAEGESIAEFTVNPKFLTSILACVPQKTVRLQYRSEVDPVRLAFESCECDISIMHNKN